MAYGSFIVGGGGGTIPRIGDVIFTTVKTSPATRYKNTVWELVAQNRVPMGAGDGHEGGETVEAGLPNIKGRLSVRALKSEYETGVFLTQKDGALESKAIGSTDEFTNLISTEDSSSTHGGSLAIDASGSNPIYGASATVQPPAYYFYFWRRVS